MDLFLNPKKMIIEMTKTPSNPCINFSLAQVYKAQSQHKDALKGIHPIGCVQSCIRKHMDIFPSIFQLAPWIGGMLHWSKICRQSCWRAQHALWLL